MRRVPHLTKAVILSQDGITLGASETLERDDAEHLAALAAGFQSLARGAGRHFGGGTARQVIIEMESGFLLVTAAGSGTCLAVITGPGADLGLVAYEMAVMVKRSGEHIRVNARTAALPRLDLRGAMPSDDEVWLDAEAGPVVRPYALTQGRTRHAGESFDLVATVMATAPRAPATWPSWRRSTSACSSWPGCRPRWRTSPPTSTCHWGWSGSSWRTCGNSAWS